MVEAALTPYVSAVRSPAYDLLTSRLGYLALNLVLLGSFTLLESFAIGIAISFYEQKVVLQAL